MFVPLFAVDAVRNGAKEFVLFLFGFIAVVSAFIAYRLERETKGQHLDASTEVAEEKYGRERGTRRRRGRHRIERANADAVVCGVIESSHTHAHAHTLCCCSFLGFFPCRTRGYFYSALVSFFLSFLCLLLLLCLHLPSKIFCDQTKHLYHRTTPLLFLPRLSSFIVSSSSSSGWVSAKFSTSTFLPISTRRRSRKGNVPPTGKLKFE